MSKFWLLEGAWDAGMQSSLVALLVWNLDRAHKWAIFNNVACIAKLMLHVVFQLQDGGRKINVASQVIYQI